jgi:hypothetical protein
MVTPSVLVRSRAPLLMGSSSARDLGMRLGAAGEFRRIGVAFVDKARRA